MFQAALKRVNSSVLRRNYQRNLISKKIYWLLLLETNLIFSSLPVLAQSSISSIVIDQNTITQSLTVEGMSGGIMTALEITNTENTATGYCDGFVSRLPNHIFKLNSFFEFLRVEVESPADTTILVQGPGGVWCNDDSHDANPMIEGEWQPGEYKVWIGSYQANSNNNYRLKITGKK